MKEYVPVTTAPLSTTPKELVLSLKTGLEEFALSSVERAEKSSLVIAQKVRGEPLTEPATGVAKYSFRPHFSRLAETVNISRAVLLAGTGEDSIYENCRRLLTDSRLYEKMSKAKNPYGDGKASARIRKVLEEEA